MKLYFCVFTQYSYHTGEAIWKTCCVVEASDKEEAKTKSYDLCGDDNSALSSVEEFNPSEGYTHDLSQCVCMRRVTMKQFSKEVDLRSRRAMTEFLAKHFRYNTMNSWNRSTSYANNIKVYNLGLNKEQEEKLYAMLDTAEFYTYINEMLSEFSVEHDHLWQVGFNGRSSGYLVLYQGYSKPSGYKSYCTECGQRNYKSVEETGNNRCGRCGADARVNYTTPPREIGCYPGRSTDMGEDFEDWEMYQLKERVKLVREFDKLCDDILKTVIDLIENYEVEEQIVMKPHTVKVLREVAS